MKKEIILQLKNTIDKYPKLKYMLLKIIPQNIIKKILLQYLSQKHIRKKEKEAWNNSIIKNQKNQKLFHERNHNTTKLYSTYN